MERANEEDEKMELEYLWRMWWKAWVDFAMYPFFLIFRPISTDFWDYITFGMCG